MSKWLYLQKWCLYSLMTIVFLFLYECFFSRISVYGVNPVFYVMLMVVPCARESLFEDLIYALLFGLIIDLAATGPTVCFHIFCFVVFAVITFYVHKRFINHSFLGVLLCYGICGILYGIFQCIAFSVNHQVTFLHASLLGLIEFLLSGIFLPLIYFPYYKISVFIAKKI